MDDTTRARAERDVLPARGASFLLDCDVLMFKFVIDTANVIGPRPATPADAERYPVEWAAFKASVSLADPVPESIEPEPALAAEAPAPVEAAALPVAEEEQPVAVEEPPADEPPAAEAEADADAPAEDASADEGSTTTGRRRRAG